MVHLSPVASDRSMLNEQIELLGLDPRPTVGFWKEDSGWGYISARFRRYVEPYSWGVFIIATERTAPYRGFSALCVGNHNARTGETTLDDGATHGLVAEYPWYADVLAEIAAGQPEIPPCMGQHKPRAVVCDGGTYGGSGFLEPPCAWRAACGRLQSWCDEKKIPPAQVLAGKTPATLIAFIDRLAPFTMPPVELSPAVERILARARTLIPARTLSLSLGAETLPTLRSMGLAMRQEYLLGHVAAIIEAVAMRLGRGLVNTSMQARVGDCYLVTRDDKGGGMRQSYISLYVMRATKAAPRSRPRLTETRLGVGLLRISSLPIEFALDVEIGASDLAPPIVRNYGGRVLPPKWRGGAFPTRVRLTSDMDIQVLIEVVVQLVQKGHIKLPKVVEAA